MTEPGRPTDQPGPQPARRPSALGVLRTPRWVLFGLLTVAMSIGMVFLGIWQLSRYQERSTINARIDAHARATPVPVEDALAVGRQPARRDQYLRVTATGRYDQTHQILARARTVNDNVGFEVITPLRLASGAAVLVDRGWLPPGGASSVAEPKVPPVPTGQVTVVGQVRLPESEAGPVQSRNGHVEVRRIDPGRLAPDLPYPVYGGYLTATSQDPPADPRFAAIPIDHENAAMNLSYIVQWWLFSGIALVGYVLLVRWEAQKRAGLATPGDRPVRSTARSGTDRVPDDRLSDDRVPEDRVPEGGVPADRMSGIPTDSPQG